MGGRIELESVADLERNQWPNWAGICIAGRDAKVAADELREVSRVKKVENLKTIRREVDRLLAELTNTQPPFVIALQPLG